MTELPQTGCPLCRSNKLLKGEVITTTRSAYLMKAQLGANNYLIIPEMHYESLLELPDEWWHEVKELISRMPDLPPDYNLSINIGKHAGQTVKHLHFWIVSRYADQPAAGKGLARLILDANET